MWMSLSLVDDDGYFRVGKLMIKYCNASMSSVVVSVCYDSQSVA